DRRQPARGSRLAAVDDGLCLRVEVERFFAVLLAVAACLPTTERELVIDLRPRVDPRVASLDPLGGRTRPLQVPSPDRGTEAERRGVGMRDRLVEIVYAPDWQRRPEHLLGGHRRIV